MSEERNRIVTENMGLVVSTARKYQGRGPELDDLVDAPLGGRENVTLLTLIANTDTSDTDLLANNKTAMDLLMMSLDTLDSREREVITCYYGLRREKLTLAEIAAQMCIKRERARQIRDKAERKMRKILNKLK